MRGHFDYSLRDLYKGEFACTYELCVNFNGFRPASSSRIFHEEVAIYFLLFGVFTFKWGYLYGMRFSREQLILGQNCRCRNKECIQEKIKNVNFAVLHLHCQTSPPENITISLYIALPIHLLHPSINTVSKITISIYFFSQNTNKATQEIIPFENHERNF